MSGEFLKGNTENSTYLNIQYIYTEYMLLIVLQSEPVT